MFFKHGYLSHFGLVPILQLQKVNWGIALIIQGTYQHTEWEFSELINEWMNVFTRNPMNQKLINGPYHFMHMIVI